MKCERLATFCISSILAFLVSFGAIACLVTGFDMAVDLSVVALWCAISALVSGICYLLPFGMVPVSVLAFVGGFLWQEGSLELSIQSLLFRISRLYNNAYGWGIIRLNMYTSDDMELTLWLGLCFIGVMIAMLVSWTVCRKKIGFPAVFAGILPLALCMVATDTVPDVVWLYLLFLGQLMILLTQTSRRQDSGQGNRLVALLALPLAVGLLILFAAVPQDTYNGQERAQRIADKFLGSDTVQTVSELLEGDPSQIPFGKDQTDLTTVGVRLESQSEMMEVTADWSGVLYLRGKAMDVYDGKHWLNSKDTAKQMLLPWPEHTWLKTAGEVQISTRYAHKMLYLPYYTRGVDLQLAAEGVKNENKLKEYSFTCDVIKDQRQLQQLYEELEKPERYIICTDAVKEWALPLLEAIPGATYGSVYQRAQAIADYVRSSATYDTNTQRMPGGYEDFARWFVEKSETGYCVHFATTATVLLQAAGIPARYVTGYMLPVEAGVATTVRLKHSHAWTEYYLPGFGWTVLEATPSIPGAQDSETTETQTEATKPQTAPTEPIKIDAPEKKGKWGWIIWTVAALLLLPGTLMVQRKLRLHIQKKQLMTGTNNQQALAYWQVAVQLAAHLKETPPQQLFLLAEKAKYSQYSLQPEEVQQFCVYVDAACQRLNQRSIFHRFWYRMILVLY